MLFPISCGNGVQNNGTAVRETFKMNKYVEPSEFPPSGYTERTIINVSMHEYYTSTSNISEAFTYVDAAPGPNKYYSYDARNVTIQGIVSNGAGKCFSKIDNVYNGRIAFYYNDTWYYGQGTCFIA